ncbi:hypothetical protein [Clostridium sp. Cult2]|uniref:hypothetical protein n=1 Tax=Clostridium sp. Cult2 TaxID=2079003 RepID=UPI001F162996|nr:hypothetical protein [Clostridium sp. Cult2]MCF6466368.1 hypothetical protein [Clostridium sp. Cult2]
MDKKDIKRIREIKERVEKATPGKWRVEKYYHDEPYEEFIKWAAVVVRNETITRNDWSNPVGADLEFIAKARQDIPYLLARLDELQEQNEALTDTVNMLSPLMMENYELKKEIEKNLKNDYAVDVLYKVINSGILDENLEEDLRDIAYYVEYGIWKG